jgi:hypothetical protein
MMITAEKIEDAEKAMWMEVKKEHDSAHLVPKEDVYRIGEIIRGLWILFIWQREGMARNAFQFLRSYSVSDAIAKPLVEVWIGQEVVVDKTEKRVNKWAAFEQFARDHAGEQFTMDSLVEISGFSYPTTLGYVKESLYFVKIKKGIYEARDIPERD